MRILVVDDEPAIRFSLAELLASKIDDVRTAEHAPAALAALEEAPADLIISDLNMPAMNGFALFEEVRTRHPDALFVLLTAHGDERTAVRALNAGAYHYIPKPFDNDELRALVTRAREVLALRKENERLRRELAREYQGMIGGNEAMRRVYDLVRRTAPTTATVLITGESGTGKELVARAMHEESTRARNPFIALNCSAIPSDLVESELFGHVRGAFTGADRDRAGVFEAAAGGTVFLDEIGDLALPAQAKLLRVLEQRQITRVGATKTVDIDVRVVAATHRDLQRLAAEGEFRADLFHRIAVITILLPPLRDRRDDIVPLTAHFIAHFAKVHGRRIEGLSEDARTALLGYAWPGNVRELRNSLERAVVLCEGNVIDAADLPPHVAGARAALRPGEAVIASLSFVEARQRALDEFDRAFLTSALEQHGGNVSRTARALGMHRQSLQKMLRKLEVQSADHSQSKP